MTLLETAKTWLSQGFTTIPLKYQSKKPIIDWLNYQESKPTEMELLQWFPNDLRNIGLITGNGLVVIDFDIQEVFDYWYSQFPIDTYMVKTRRGVHVYITTWEPAKNYHSELLDIKAERGYVLIPPSIHPSGYQYQVWKNSPIRSVGKLTDILPTEYLPEVEKISMVETDRSHSVCDVQSDPWDIADNAVEVDSILIQKIKANVSILSMLNADPSSRDGRWYVASCPFHKDSNPSFWIDLQRGMCGCRKCNIKEMDVCNLYARLHKISNQDAIRELARMI